MAFVWMAGGRSWMLRTVAVIICIHTRAGRGAACSGSTAFGEGPADRDSRDLADESSRRGIATRPPRAQLRGGPEASRSSVDIPRGSPSGSPTSPPSLVRLKVDVIVVDACGASINAASQATSAIPIVVAACNDDLVAAGRISSLARPGGNITGLSELTPELGAKRLDLLKEAVPKMKRVAVLWNPTYSERLSANFRFWSSDWIAMRARVPGVGHRASIRGDPGPRRFRCRVLSHDQGASRRPDCILGPHRRPPRKTDCRSRGEDSPAGNVCIQRGCRGRRPDVLRAEHL